MKDAAAAIQQAYYDRLNESGLWPCFDQPPVNAAFPINRIESIQTQDASTKSSRGQFVTVQISCNAVYSGDAGGKKDVEEQASLLCALIDDRSHRIDCKSDFHIITTVLESSMTFDDPRNDPQSLIRRVLRFRHLVEEVFNSP